MGDNSVDSGMGKMGSNECDIDCGYCFFLKKKKKKERKEEKEEKEEKKEK